MPRGVYVRTEATRRQLRANVAKARLTALPSVRAMHAAHNCHQVHGAMAPKRRADRVTCLEAHPGVWHRAAHPNHSVLQFLGLLPEERQIVLDYFEEA